MAIRNPYVHTVHIHMEIPYGFSISIRLMDRKPVSSTVVLLILDFHMLAIGQDLATQNPPRHLIRCVTGTALNLLAQFILFATFAANRPPQSHTMPCPHETFRADHKRMFVWLQAIDLQSLCSAVCSDCDILRRAIEGFRPGWIRNTRNSNRSVLLQYPYEDPGFLSIRHIHMEIFHMDTYGHTKINLASGHNTTLQSSLLNFYRLQSSQQLR